MWSMVGQTTRFLSSAIQATSGSIQPMLASQCESRKMSSSPSAALAPMSRARIRPSLFGERTSLTWE